ncbi:MAG: hypothetical protein PVJ40_04155 [Gammaproteobacteria bacterium]|jgi:hypothetical protein
MNSLDPDIGPGVKWPRVPGGFINSWKTGGYEEKAEKEKDWQKKRPHHGGAG